MIANKTHYFVKFFMPGVVRFFVPLFFCVCELPVRIEH